MSDSTNVFSPLRPTWLADVTGVGYDDEFWDIINFYVLHSLCGGQSWKGHNLHDTYLWKVYPWQPTAYLKDKIIKAIWKDERPCLYMAEKRALFQGKIDGKNLDADFNLDTRNQRAGYVKSSNGKNNDNEIMSFFYHIRNGFAHGRYGMVPISDSDYMIFLEDGKAEQEQFEVTARIVIKKSSLIAIKNIIIEGPEDEPNYAEEIIESIKRGNSSRKKIMEDIDISERVWEKESQKLKNAKRIIFENRKWRLVEEL